MGARLRTIRVEVYGEHGIDTIGERLGVAPKTWQSYEAIGEVVPAQVLLQFIELTGVDPLWLMRGEGMKYRELRRRSEPDPSSSAGPSSQQTAPGDVGLASGQLNGRPPSSDPV